MTWLFSVIIVWFLAIAGLTVYGIIANRKASTGDVYIVFVIAPIAIFVSVYMIILTLN